MPTQDVTITVPVAPHLVDIDAVKLAARKVVVPAAIDSHGTQVQHVAASATNLNSTVVIVRVVT